MSDLNLTKEQAYAAALHFLERMHQEFGWKELGALLGSMALIDGAPVDHALSGDWGASVQVIINAQVNAADSLTLTSKEAYVAMLEFLDAMFFNAKREMLEPLIDGMRLIDGAPADRALLGPWEKAVKFARDGGKPDSFTVTKDNVAYEVHCDLQKPEKP